MSELTMDETMQQLKWLRVGPADLEFYFDFNGIFIV